MKKKTFRPPPENINWPRADPAALARFDPSAKVCMMNCGPHIDDPRSKKELKFLCSDCLTAGEKL